MGERFSGLFVYGLSWYDLMGSSLQVLDEEVNATNGADNAPHIFDHNCQGNDDESSLASSASKNNNTSMFSKSIEDLGKNHFEVAKLIYEQKETDRLQIAEAAK